MKPHPPCSDHEDNGDSFQLLFRVQTETVAVCTRNKHGTGLGLGSGG